MNVATIIALLGVVLPLITELVKWAEAMQVPGDVKKENVMSAFTSIWGSLVSGNLLGKDLQGVTTEQATTVVSSAIDSVVSIFNALGIFKKAVTPAA